MMRKQLLFLLLLFMGISMQGYAERTLPTGEVYYRVHLGKWDVNVVCWKEDADYAELSLYQSSWDDWDEFDIPEESMSSSFPNGERSFKLLYSIGEGAFWDCKKLTRVALPACVRNIGSYAFKDCINLPGIDLPVGLKTIGDSVFIGCSKLTNIVIPARVMRIGCGAFGACDNLVSLSVDNNNVYYSAVDGILYSREKDTLVAYPGGKEADYLFPESVTAIGGGAFFGCNKFSSLEIPSGITCINDAAFYRCGELTSIRLPEGITEIPDRLMGECKKLVSVNVPNGVTKIGAYAFRECNSLKEIILPENLTTIRLGAFEGVVFQKVVMNNPVPPLLYNDVFSAAAYENATLYVPKGTMAAYQSAYIWKKFKNIEEMDLMDAPEIVAGEDAGALEISCKDGMLTIQSKVAQSLIVYTLLGQVVATVSIAPGENRISGLSEGVYIVNGQKVSIN